MELCQVGFCQTVFDMYICCNLVHFLFSNEKEGIPADLLPFLDVCVEIPQEGVVRSLNVHVTGALFVWEYMRQQALTGTHSNRVRSQEEET